MKRMTPDGETHEGSDTEPLPKEGEEPAPGTDPETQEEIERLTK